VLFELKIVTGLLWYRPVTNKLLELSVQREEPVSVTLPTPEILVTHLPVPLEV
jgi:hypothetical protein